MPKTPIFSSPALKKSALTPVNDLKARKIKILGMNGKLMHCAKAR